MLFILTCLSITIIIVLFLLADVPNILKNGFNRNFYTEKAEPISYQSIPNSSVYFAGQTSNTLFLGDYQQSSVFRQIDIQLKHSSISTIPLAKPHAFYSIQVDSPFLFTSLSQDSIVQVFFLKKDQVYPVIGFQIPVRYTLFYPIDTGNILFRSVDTGAKESVISKYQKNKNQIFSHHFLESQGNGFFSTDGMLTYDRFANHLIYIYYYRNQFICADSNINLLYRARTIDTNRWSKLNIREIRSSQLFTFAKPPVVINQKSFAYHGFLYILSALLSDNENRQTFSKSSVVDVYDLRNGHYRRSFYITDFDGFKVKEFTIIDHSLYAIQGNFIVRHSLAFDP